MELVPSLLPQKKLAQNTTSPHLQGLWATEFQVTIANRKIPSFYINLINICSKTEILMDTILNIIGEYLSASDKFYSY